MISLTRLPRSELESLLSGSLPYDGTGFSEFDRTILQHCQDYCAGTFNANAPHLIRANLLRDDLAFGFTDALDVNAAASSIITNGKRYDVIWINAGTALELQSFYSEVLQDPGIFHWVVGDEMRALLTLVLLRWSLLFVQLHELMHVLFGHIDYLESKLRGLPMVNEAEIYGDTAAPWMANATCDPSGSPLNRIIWRMEAEADEFATRAAVLPLLVQPADVHPTLFNQDRERMMYAWTFAMVSVFVFFERLSGGKKVADSDHPDPQHRLSAALIRSAIDAKKLGVFRPDEGSKSIALIGILAWADLDKCLKRVHGDAYNAKFNDSTETAVQVNVGMFSGRDDWQRFRRVSGSDVALALPL